jgi:hypothetical protein
MITLMFLKSWFKWAAGTTVALLAEFVFLRGHLWILTGVALGTVLVSPNMIEFTHRSCVCAAQEAGR